MEGVLAGLGGLVLAIVMTWPTLRHPASTVPADLGDPLLQAWQVAWGGHALLHQPLHPFDANIFWPLPNSLAFSDSLLGYAWLGALGSGPTAAVVHYNLLYVGASALAFTGAYLLARQLGASRLAALVAGAAFGYAPWRLAQAGHLQILSTGGIPLALALLARGHGYRLRRRREDEIALPKRPWLVFAGWVVAAWQLTIGFGLGLQFAYLLAVVVVVAVGGWLLGRRRAGTQPLPRRFVAAELAGMVLFVAVGAGMATPYQQVVIAHPEARRGVADVALFSPPFRGFLTTPATDWLWGPHQEQARQALPFDAEMTLAPGLTLVVLAVLGLVLSGWPWRRRLVLLGAVVVTVVLAMGTRFLGGGHYSYLLLFHLPGWQGVRTPGRLVVITTLALALLAAAGVDALLRRWHSWPRALGGLGLAGLVLVEGLGTLAHPSPAPVPVALRSATPPLYVIPSDEFHDDQTQLWSTAGFPALVNGSSGFVPAELALLRRDTAGFPDAASVALLRERGVRTVVLLSDRAAGTPWADAASRPVDTLGITRTVRGTVVVYDLSPG